MPKLASHADAVPHSGIREIVHLVVRREDVVRLEIGEPGYATPEHIVAAGREAAASSKYTQSAGMLELREALADKLARVNGIEVTGERVIVSQGAVQGCAVTLAALVTPGAEVLVPDPAWPNYEMLVKLYGGRPVHYPLHAHNGFVPDVGEVSSLVTDRTVALIMNTPGNPTGAVFPPDVVTGLVDLVRARDITMIADEVYDELIFEGAPANAHALAPDNVVGVYSFSKTYAMTGWRVGYVCAPPWLAATLEKLQEPMISCIAQLTQVAALEALAGPQDCVAVMREGYRARRDLAMDLLRAEGLQCQTPRGAFYLMLPLEPRTDSRAAAIDMLRYGVSVAPGTAFGTVGADHFRLSLASDEDDLREGIARIARWYGDTSGGRKLGT